MYFFLNFNRRFCKQNSGVPDYAASDLDLHCLQMSHKRDAWLILHFEKQCRYNLCYVHPLYIYISSPSICFALCHI